MTDPEVFIVRIWRQLASGFRASARRVDDEEARFFSRPEDISRFFSSSEVPVEPAEPAASPRTNT